MAKILIADDGIEFDGKTLLSSPLGGVETSIIHLTEELAKLGHWVQVRNNCKIPMDHLGVEWRNFGANDWPKNIDLYIANRGDKLINLYPTASRRVFWTHNPANYLIKWRYLSKLWRYQPTIIFIGTYHATTYPKCAPGGERLIIPYGISEIFCQSKERSRAPRPKVIFTSNPLRSLDWLIDLWITRIEPRIPGAELHIFSGALTYGSVGEKKISQMNRVFSLAREHEKQGVKIRGPVTKSQLVREFREARCILYRGDLNETFCLAIGEAQASGVPAVVRDFGSVVERVKNNETGFIAEDDNTFVSKAIKLMTDDGLWLLYHKRAIELQRNWRWSDVAKAFEKLIE